jgi:DNA polymerase-3 subunit gamma/tau
MICEAEGIRASESSLRLIARAGEGSVRDSVALLDQLATFGAGGIEDEDAARLLGGLDTALLHDLLAAIVGGDGGAVVRLAGRLEDEGWDPRSVYGQFLAYCRDALHLALAGGGAGGGAAGRTVDLPEEDAAALAALAGDAGYENLLRLLQQLLAGEPIVRRSENGYIAAEITWLRAAELPKLVRVEELLGGGFAGRERAPGREDVGGGARGEAAPAARRPTPAPEPASPPPPAAEANSDPRPDAEPLPAEPLPAAAAVPDARPVGGATAEPPPAVSDPATSPTPAPPTPEPASPKPQASHADEPPAAPSAAAPAADSAALAASLLAGVRRFKPPLAARLETAGELSVDGDRLLIRYASDDDDLRERLASPRNRETLDQVVTATLGPGSRWQARGDLPPAVSNGAGAGTDDGEAGAGAAPPQVAEHPTVQTVLQLFDGRIEAVEADEPPEADEEAAEPVAAQREENA